MLKLPLLSIIIFLPLLGAIFIWCIEGKEETIARNSKYAALWTSLFTFFLSLFLWFNYDASNPDFQFVEKIDWIKGYEISYYIGLDGISLLFVILSTFLTPICILSSWEAIQKRVKEYMMAFLVLETFMVGMFSALDFLLFYVFFEAVLIPMFLIIGIWGGENKIYAAFKFFLYTLAGSVLMLLAIFAIYFDAGTMDIVKLMQHDIAKEMQFWLWIAFFAAFAVKVPMWPVHTWLPDAHVQAPTAGSVILAGVLLKMGAYGFIRFSIPMLPHATLELTPIIYTLSVVAVIYTSLVALAQTDMKKLIAYSSIAHMGFVTIGLFTITQQGIEGALFQMLSHGLVSAALFLCVGVVYDRMHTREISSYGGLAKSMPIYAAFFMFFIMASVGLPGTSGFVGEMLVLVGAFQVNQWVTILAALGIVLGAAYALWLYRRVVFGKLEKQELMGMKDLNMREKAIFIPIILIVLWMGLYPNSFLGVMHSSVEKLMADYKNAITEQVAER